MLTFSVAKHMDMNNHTQKTLTETMTIFIKERYMTPREPQEGKEAVSSGRAGGLLVRSDTYYEQK